MHQIDLNAALRSVEVQPNENREMSHEDLNTARRSVEMVEGDPIRFKALARAMQQHPSEALSDDLKKEVFKELSPPALEQTIKEFIMFRNMKEDTWSAAQIQTIINGRISGDVMN